MNRGDLTKQIAIIEEGYEFFLAFAAQGVRDDTTSATGGELRRYLERMNDALGKVARSFRTVVETGVEAPESFGTMIDVLERDAANARAAVQLVLSRSSISSQLIDNLNASIHVRALLTDLFLMDEALPPDTKSQSAE